jgi:putative ABC transport system permease protein
MNILTLPLRTLRRKLARSLLLTMVFALGICSVVALNYVSAAVGQSMEKKLTAYGANIVLKPKVDTLSVDYGGLGLGNVSLEVKHLTQEQVDRVRTIALRERIAAVAPKLIAQGSVNGRPVALIGVDWPEEMEIKNYWSISGRQPDGPWQVLAGARAARTLGLAPGDSLGLSGRVWSVAGVLAETGSEDDNVLFAGLGDVQEVTGKPGQVHYAEVAALCSACPIEDIVAQIAQKLPDVDIVAMQKVIKSRMYTVHFVQHLALSVSLILLLTACAMISLSLLASVNERKHEIGVLRSLGYSKARVFAIFSLEALLMGLAAGLVGYVSGFAASFKVMDILELSGQADLNFQFSHLALTLAVVGLISCLSAALPAWRAANTDPSQALVML